MNYHSLTIFAGYIVCWAYCYLFNARFLSYFFFYFIILFLFSLLSLFFLFLAIFLRVDLELGSFFVEYSFSFFLLSSFLLKKLTRKTPKRELMKSLPLCNLIPQFNLILSSLSYFFYMPSVFYLYLA